MATQWLAGYPLITENISGTAVTASGTINQSGELSAVIVPSASGIPTAAQVIAGQDASGNALGAGFNDSGVVVSASGTVVALSGYSLTSETAYVMYVAASGYDDGIIANASGLNFTTPDITAPLWISGYPQLYSTYFPGDPTYSAYATSGIYALAVDCASRGYALTLASGSAVPTSAAIKLSGSVVDMPTSGVVYYTTKYGLTENTAYTAYCVAEDIITLNLQASGTAFSYTTLDITPPTWGSGYPSGVSTTVNTATFAVNASEDNCEGYYIEMASGAPAVPAATIKSLGNSISLPEATGIYTCVVSGLNSDTAYAVNFVAEDIFNNLQATGVIVYCLTVDNIPPTWSGVYPILNTAYATSGVFSLAVDAASCSGFGLALPIASGLPTSSGVKESGVAIDMALAGTVYNLTITGLVPNTAYSAHLVAQDEYANLQTIPQSVLFSTDVTPPAWNAGYPNVGTITTNSAIMSMNLDDAGSGYCVVVLNGASSPSATQIKAGQDATGTSVAAGFAGSTPLVSGTTATINLTNLAYSTQYTVYAVGEDDADNATSPAVVSANFRAAVPGPGVVFSGGRQQKKDRARRLKNRSFNTFTR